MRLDYPLYALAIIFFAITAVTFTLVTDPNGRDIYAVSTVVIGLSLAIAGYLVRPKTEAATVSPQTQPPQKPAPPTAPQPVVPAEAPVIETPLVEQSKIETLPMIDAPKIVTPALEKPAVVEALPSAPVKEAPAIEAAAPALATELTQIKGINGKRAAQLRANGIKSVEDLAKASSSDLAVKLEVSEKIIKMWIGSARKLVK